LASLIVDRGNASHPHRPPPPPKKKKNEKKEREREGEREFSVFLWNSGVLIVATLFLNLVRVVGWVVCWGAMGDLAHSMEFIGSYQADLGRLDRPELNMS
jgi:hypothetical protein